MHDHDLWDDETRLPETSGSYRALGQFREFGGLEAPALAGQYGEKVAGRYELRLIAGQGATSTVWQAEDTRLGRCVAVKILSADLARSPLHRARFDREAAFTRWVSSRWLSRGLDCGVNTTSSGAQLPYLVTEFIEGRTLAEHLGGAEAQQNRSLTSRELEGPVRTVVQMARALARVHGFGVVHRDVCPANVLITRDGALARLIDFGVSRVESDDEEFDSERGLVVGTPGYRAPEQSLALDSLDFRADIFALGLVAFELITGVSVASAAPDVVDSDLPEFSDVGVRVPAPVERWFRRACATNPDDRFQSAAEMAIALHSAADLSGDVRRHLLPVGETTGSGGDRSVSGLSFSGPVLNGQSSGRRRG